MNTLALLSACLSIGMGVWLGQCLFFQASQHYRRRVTEQTRAELSDLFVFIDTTHLWPALVCVSVGVCGVCGRCEFYLAPNHVESCCSQASATL